MKIGLLSCASLLVLVPCGLAQSPDRDAELVRQLAAQPAAGPGAFLGTPPRELFHEDGDDNVVALLVQPDGDGDGVPEIVTGWDIFKSDDNLTVSRGAGFLPGQLVWGLETADGISGGYFPGQEALVTYPDSNSDGFDEVIACTGGGGRAATLYDGATGAVMQSFNTYLGTDSGWVYDVEVVGDVNDNGTVDFAIAVGSNDDAVYMIDGGSSGTHHDFIWRHQGADVFYGVVTVGDLNDDGVPDVVAGNGDNSNTLKALSGATGAVLWTISQGANNWHVQAFPDIDGNSIDEVLVGSWQNQGVRLINGSTGAIIWTASAGSTLVFRVSPFPDVDGDGLAEVIAAGSGGGATMFDGHTGAVLWNRNVGSNVWSIDPVGDVTGDGIGEVAFGDFTGLTRLVDGTDGSDLWQHSANGHKVLALIGCQDLDGDGQPEVIVGAQQLASGVDTLLWVLDADSGLAGGPPEQTPAGLVTLGTSFDLVLTGATPGENAWLLGGLQPALAPLFGLGVLGVDPTNFQGFGVRVVPAGGTLSILVNVPADPVFDGLSVYLQQFVLNGAGTAGVSSNRTGHLLQL
jgi:hypothetical protein